ncbi:MAG: tetratricopeptide repeat protein [Bacteroidota bacterium]
MRYLLFLGLFLASCRVHGQQEVDLVDKYSGRDTTREMAVLIEIRANEGQTAYEQGDYQQAVAAFQQAAKLIEKSSPNKVDLLASCYQKAASSCAYLEWYDLAETFALKSITHARLLENPTSLVLDFSTLAKIYHKQGQFDKALSYYDSCLQIDRHLNDTVYIANDLSAIGRINTQIGREQEGLQQLETAVAMTNPIQFPRTHCLGLNALGLGYLNCKAYKKAEQYVLASLTLSQQIRDTNLIVNRYINLGELYNKMGRPDKAIANLRNSLGLLKDCFQPHKYATIYRNLGEAYQQKQDYEKANNYYQRALEIATNKNLLPEMLRLYQQLQVVYRAKNDFKTALTFAEKASVLSDSIFSLKARVRADIFNNQFVSAKKEQAIRDLSHENALKEKDLQVLALQKKWWLYFLLVGLILVGIGFYTFQQKQKGVLHQKQQKINQQFSEIQLLKEDVTIALAEKERSLLTTNLSLLEINQLIKEPLSEREFDILQLLVRGKNNKEIAKTVFLSVNTVKYHLKNIYAKLEVKNRVQAVQLALKK